LGSCFHPFISICNVTIDIHKRDKREKYKDFAIVAKSGQSAMFVQCSGNVSPFFAALSKNLQNMLIISREVLPDDNIACINKM